MQYRKHIKTKTNKKRHRHNSLRHHLRHSKRQRRRRATRRRHIVVPVFSKNNDKFDLPDELESTPTQEIKRKNTQENSSGNIIEGMRDFFIKKKGFVM